MQDGRIDGYTQPPDNLEILRVWDDGILGVINIF